MCLKKYNALFTVRRPRSYWDVVGSHFPFALITGTALLLSFIVPLRYLPIRKCTLLDWTGIPCPFCGFTRSFWAISDGRWEYALENCPLAGLVYPAVFLVFAWNLAGLAAGVQLKKGRWLKLDARRRRGLFLLLCVLLIVNWAYRLAHHLS